MIVLLDTSEDLAVCEAEIGCEVGQLLTPLTGFRLRDPVGRKWAVDNGAYSDFNAERYLRRLKRHEHIRPRPLFVSVPDVVGSARRTLELFYHWKDLLRGWPLALVAQDGLQNFSVPWPYISALFVGGTTHWKLGEHAAACVKAAKALGKHVHIGRINTPDRFTYFMDELKADSCDGSGIAQYSFMREAIARRNQHPQVQLFAHDLA